MVELLSATEEMLMKERIDALIQASIDGHLAIVEFLLPTNIPIKDRCWALVVAIERDHSDIGEKLMANMSDEERTGALRMAAPNNRFKAVQFLLGKGIPDQRRGAALSNASYVGDQDMVEFLLTTHIPIQDRCSALVVAIEEDHLGIGEKVMADLSDEERTEALIMASGDNCLKAVQFLLGQGILVQGRGDALINASYKGCPDVVELLLTTGILEDAREAALLVAVEN